MSRLMSRLLRGWLAGQRLSLVNLTCQCCWTCQLPWSWLHVKETCEQDTLVLCMVRPPEHLGPRWVHEAALQRRCRVAA